MPNWGAIAKSIATGMYGDEVQDYLAKKQQMQLEQERFGLAKNADARAQAGESREADTYEFSKSQRPLLLKRLQQQIDSGELDFKEAQNKLAIFDAEGGVEGEVGRRKTKFDQDVQKHGQSMKESQASIANMAADNARAAAQEARAKTREEVTLEGERLQNEFARGTQAARMAGVNAQNDPDLKKRERLSQLINYAKVAPEEDMEMISAEIRKLVIGHAASQAANAANPNAEPITPDNVVKKWGFK